MNFLVGPKLINLLGGLKDRQNIYKSFLRQTMLNLLERHKLLNLL